MEPRQHVLPPAPSALAAGGPVPAGAAPDLVLTEGEHRALTAELRVLRTRRDRELPDRLREARTYVTADAIEETGQIQEEQAVADARISRIEELLAVARVVPDDEAGDLVSIGCVVDVEYAATSRRATYRLTGAGAGAGNGCVSARSPIGQALMGRRAGDVVTAVLPTGRSEELRIVGVARALQDEPDAAAAQRAAG